MLASVLVIEQGAFISEQNKYGQFYFTNFYVLLFFLTTVVSFIFFFQVFKKIFKFDLPRFKFLGKSEISLVYGIAIIVMVFAYISLLSSPSVYTSDKITKFNYWESAAYPELNALLGNTIGYLPFALGLIFSRYKKTTLVLIVLYMVYLVGVDQKFTAFLYGFIGFLISYSIMHYQSKNNFNILSFKKRYLVIVCVLAFSLVLAKYSNKNPFEYLNLTPVESVFYRAFGLQAHVFWGVTEKYVHNDEPNTWDLSELSYGMQVVMEDFTPTFQQRYLKNLWSRGVSWTNAYPSILMRIFPVPIGLLFHFFIFSIVPLIYVLLINTVRTKNYIFSIILVQLSLWLTNIYSMAFFYRLTKVVIILILLLLLAYIYKIAKKES